MSFDEANTELANPGTISVQPFGVNFEEECVKDSNRLASTNTYSMSDDDTGTYRKDTEDGDT